MEKFVCCICGNEFEGYGNNPAPVCDEPGMRCCDCCNEEVVIPERVTPAGIVLAEQKLHGGLGFELMFDCFTYEGVTEEELRRRYVRHAEPIKNGITLISLIKIIIHINLSPFHYKVQYYAPKDNHPYKILS
mgnify:CR=1 FL=1